MGLFQYTRPAPAFNTVVAGSTASTLLPTGPTYQVLVLAYSESGTAADEETFKAAVDEIRVKVNGITRINMTGTELVTINKFFGHSFVAGAVPVFLARPFSRTLEGGDNLSWGTQNVDSLVVEVDIASGRTNPALKLLTLGHQEKRDLGIIREVHRIPASSSAGGQFEVSSLPRGNGNLLALHAAHTYVTGLQVRIDQVDIINCPDAGGLIVHNMLMSQMTGRAPQAGYVHVDPTAYRDLLSDVWPVGSAQDWRVVFSLSAADSIQMVMETLSTPLGLPATV